ncbi:helix-turn-helix domain-containing protein [candidate division WWE3 bacterium]|uniref:Helix-turn-helix domain-containing protein n=1 Tax=candidate division WWE3 bacterium TaxID=2053526 RepID=A0A7X9DJV3_UNCKA|nr:helix-turn-helix domain-containing protein [candidate division WWE3 bacterium]
MIQLEERLYTSTEVAEILGVSLRSVYRYLEEGKLDAEIKTATGRHRFSKKNIIDFLYPAGSVTPRDLHDDVPVKETPKKASMAEDVVKEQPKIVETPVIASKDTVTKTEPIEDSVSAEPEVAEEPVDWLAKFREAAKKFREESDTLEASTETKPTQENFTGFSGVTSEPIRTAPATKSLYYRSSLGGLKDIAQNIDKTSRSAGVPYAFSMNAGLSLYKPIKPFSVLHAYVKPSDLPFFERVLGLTPSEEAGAQLCLYVSSDTGIFANREEMHGLFVVSKTKLLEDITKTGDNTLIDEAKSVL